MKDIAILILNYNNYNLTIECVNNLIKIKSQYQIVIVDNNSPNDSYKLLSDEFSCYENIAVIKSEYNGGYSYGNNYGIKYIDENFNDIKYLVIMNPDIIIKDINVIENIVNIIKENSQVVMSTGLGFTNDILNQGSFGWKIPTFIELVKSNLSFTKIFKKNTINIPRLEKKNGSYIINDVISGCFFAISLNYLKSIGYLDENVFLYFEENILASKIKMDKFKVAISVNDLFYHNHILKDKNLKKINEKKRDYKYFCDSQKYYYNNILRINIIKKAFIEFIIMVHRYIEIPIINLLKR